MLSAPEDLTEQTLSAALTREWGIVVATLEYAPVGFGSHHWVATDQAGTGWFVTVDDLRTRLLADGEPVDAAYRRLRSALDAARGLREHGATFALAPLSTAGDEPVARLDDRYTAALFPRVDGESFEFGRYRDEQHRDAVLEMVVAVHTAPAAVRDRAIAEAGVPHRDALEAALDGTGPAGSGPYAQRAAQLFEAHADAVRGLLDRHDALAAGVDPLRSVLTHGEPHAGNTMRTADGWRLLDWDTARVAPPERDLWHLGDGVLAAYEKATGVAPRPDLLELYRLRWQIADLAMEADRFGRPHAGTEDDATAFAVVEQLLSSTRLHGTTGE